jgi:hypothetical protein
LTLRLNSQLFYGDTISTIVSDEDIVPDAIDNLKQLLLQVDLDREFPKEFVENNKTKSTDKELKDKAKTLALVNLVLHSSTMQTVLDSYFDKDAIPYLLENINDEDYLMEYRKIKRKLRHSETITDLANNLIDVIENNNY